VSPQLLILGTFAVVALLIIGPYYLFVVREETADKEMIRQRIRTGRPVTRTQVVTGNLLKEAERFSVIGPLNRALAGNSRFAVKIRDTVHMSGLKITPGQLVFGSLTLGMLVYLLVFLRIERSTIAAIAGLIVMFLPYGVLSFMRTRRINKFEEQFPDAVDLIARALRAGHAFTTGLGMAADELPQPVAGEFKLLFDQQNYGLPLNEALKNLARRVPLIDARFFVTAVLTQREAGGNLAEVLDNLSRVIRERFKIRRQLRVLTAHGGLTGWILAGLPPALAFYMFLTRPEHFRLLVDDPLGVKMVFTAIALQVFGAFLIYKISDIEY
jgi:tight adherence protein B